MNTEPLVVYLRGGLGSQLFPIYAGWVLSQEFGRPMSLDITQLAPDLMEHDRGILDYEPVFPFVQRPVTPYRRLRQVKRRLIGSAPGLSGAFTRLQRATRVGLSPTIERNAYSLGDLLKMGADPEIKGFFPSWEIANEARLRGLPLNIRPLSLSLEAERLRHRIEEGETAIVHIRRGDFLQYVAKFGELGPDYYRRAFEVVESVFGVGQVLCFSDAPAEASDLLRQAGVPHHLADASLRMTSAETLWAMSAAMVHIGSNSALSWHAAFWAPSDALRVVPEPRYPGEPDNPLYPAEWVRVDSGY